MLIARTREKALLQGTLRSEYSQFIAVYGRRRVGKTFLIRESFGYHFAFEHSGLARGSLAQQLAHFCDSLGDAGFNLPKDRPTCSARPGGIPGADSPSSWSASSTCPKSSRRSASLAS